MNAAVRAVVRTATKHGISVVAYLDGYSGLVEGRMRELDDRAVGSQIQRGGTFIGTSRCAEFREPSGRARAAAQLRADGSEGLVVIGGDGSFRGALLLQEEHGVAVTGLPGTIDNDVFGTDESIGFDTALNTAVEAIDRIRDTSESTGTLFFVEVMGRGSGALAMHVALAAGAAGILVPEEEHEMERVAGRIRSSISRGKRSHIIVVAEGEAAGGAFTVAESMAPLLGCPHRVAILGHVQRGGRPTARDRIIASMMGAQAVEALAAGRTGVMAGMSRGAVVEVPLTDVVAYAHAAANMDVLRLAQSLAG